MEKHENWCTHIKNPEDVPYLTSPLFDVNIRLFHTNSGYKKLVLDACTHIRVSCGLKKEGYKQPHGWSGANAGIPWNIIAYMEDGHTYSMINPRIDWTHINKKQVKSNCGSLTLKEPITIERFESVRVKYYDIFGQLVSKLFGPTPGFTIQHEIEHNLGILITHKKVGK